MTSSSYVEGLKGNVFGHSFNTAARTGVRAGNEKPTASEDPKLLTLSWAHKLSNLGSRANVLTSLWRFLWNPRSCDTPMKGATSNHVAINSHVATNFL